MVVEVSKPRDQEAAIRPLHGSSLFPSIMILKGESRERLPPPVMAAPCSHAAHSPIWRAANMYGTCVQGLSLRVLRAREQVGDGGVLRDPGRRRSRPTLPSGTLHSSSLQYYLF
jgi:hypothetical protein